MKVVDNVARAFAPAGVGNIGVGFDLLGHSIDGPRDVARVRRVAAPGVRITAIVGDATGADAIPLEVERNTAGQALASLHAVLGLAFGFELMLEKGIPIGAGLGGSAASCVAALVAANALLDVPLPRAALYPFAIDGEAVSSHSRQGDNVAPILLDGVVMAKDDQMIAMPAADWQHCVILHPTHMLEPTCASEIITEPYTIQPVGLTTPQP